jgi:hypothetical protein
MAAQDQGLNAIAGEGIVKHKKSVYPNKIAVHLAGRRGLPPPQERTWLKWGGVYKK